MMTKNKNQVWRYVSFCTAALAMVLFLGDGSIAVAAEDGSSHSGTSDSGHSGGVKGKRGGGGGHDSSATSHDSGSDAGSTHVKGKDKGSHGGKKGSDSVTRDRGRRPVWAQEGLPDVELGRLNASRAPDHVLSRALAEAHATMEADPQASIHSPPQNLALYWEAMTNQETWTREQAAGFLATAADKRIAITAETVNALNLILGVSESDPEGMAQTADKMRQQILAEHDAGAEAGGTSGH